MEAARSLVEVEGVHAIVGPNASPASLPVLAYVKEIYDATVALAPTPPAAPQALRWRSDLRRS